MLDISFTHKSIAYPHSVTPPFRSTSYTIYSYRARYADMHLPYSISNLSFYASSLRSIIASCKGRVSKDTKTYRTRHSLRSDLPKKEGTKSGWSALRSSLHTYDSTVPASSTVYPSPTESSNTDENSDTSCLPSISYAAWGGAGLLLVGAGVALSMSGYNPWGTSTAATEADIDW